MKEWKIKQEIFHRLNKNHDDDLKNHKIIIDENIVENAVKYFETTELEWVYPAKSYVVAICYARWISEEYNENFYDLLNDEMLLFGNDPHFKTYSENKEFYDEILNRVGLNFDVKKGIIPDVRKYYEQEINYV